MSTRVDPTVEKKPAKPRLNSSKFSLPSAFLSRVLNWLVAYRPMRLNARKIRKKFNGRCLQGFLSKVEAVTFLPHSQMVSTVTKSPLVHMWKASSIALSNFPPH